jgi:FkbM family methyltransferase
LFKLIQKIFFFFNLKIFYSKDIDILKDIDIDTIIDVGVEKGTDFLTNKFPDAKYYLIEANPIFYEHLEKDFLKKFKGKLFKSEAGNEIAKKYLFDSGPISSFYTRDDYKFKDKRLVSVLPLDNILKNEEFRKNTLLKVDCEGGELDVLNGASNILNIVSYVIVELRLQKIKTYNPSDLINYLFQKNFIWSSILKIYYAKYGIDYIDILFVKKAK